MAEEYKYNAGEASEVGDLNWPQTPTAGIATIAGASADEKSVRVTLTCDDYIMSHILSFVPGPAKDTAKTRKFMMDKAYTFMVRAGFGPAFVALGATTLAKILAFIAKTAPGHKVAFAYVPPAPGAKYGKLEFLATEAEAHARLMTLSSGFIGAASGDSDISLD